MKKFQFIVICLIASIAFYSCKKGGFLDNQSTNTLNNANVFADSLNTIEFLSGLYTNVGFDMDPRTPDNRGGIYSECSDESETRYPSAAGVYNQISGGTFGSQFFLKLDKDWIWLYNMVRQANIYLAGVDKAPISNALKSRTKAEARFLRVWYYHLLMKYYGGIPLLGDNVYGLEDKNDLARSTYAECIDYLVKELDEAAPLLPSSYQGSLDYGRATKGACLALKSRILLFAASPQFNGGSVATNPALVSLTAYPAFDKNRWEKARLAAKAVIDLGTFSLNVDNTTKPGYGFYKVFLIRVNNEFIFSRMIPPGNEIEIQYNPPSRGGKQFLHFPTQDLVDKFPMANGKAISDAASGYKETDPYVNRDPRFGYTVIYNGSLYYDNSLNALGPVYTYQGAAQDGLVAISSNSSTNTGYYHRKLCDENITATKGGNSEGVYPLIRYAEILLNYAEAANEMGMATDAMAQLKQLRMRAGITAGADGNYGLPANPSVATARDIIQNERAIELAFEEHRYWDVRRWKIGAAYDGKQVTGMQITKTGNNYTYKRIGLRTRYFKDNSYLFPLPQTEISLNPKLLQNPGW